MTILINSSLKNVATEYLGLLGVKVAKSTFIEILETHPHYPSLLSLSETFDRFNIDNVGYNVEEGKLVLLQPPFITYLGDQPTGKDFVLIIKIEHGQVIYSTGNFKEKTIPLESFLVNYQGTVWFAEVTPESGHAEYSEIIKKEKRRKAIRIGFRLASIALFLIALRNSILFQKDANLFQFLSMALLKATGLGLTVMLLMYESDGDNPLVKSICEIGSNSGCNRVLKSKQSRIFGISLSEIGFIYFSSTFLWLIAPLDFRMKIIALALVNGFAAPFIFFSVYYQWKIARQWCTLCLSVQFILSAELIWSIFYFWRYPIWAGVPLSVFTTGAFCVLLPVLIWREVKRLMRGAKDGDFYRSAFTRLQRNPLVFEGLLKQERMAPLGYEDLGITLGSPGASTTIIKVCNPYCGPCARMHPQLDELLECNDVRVKILFKSNGSLTDPDAKIVNCLLAIAAKGNEQHTKAALSDWYLGTNKDFESFSAKWHLDGDLKKYKLQIDEMTRWCTNAEVTYTPTVFINGRAMPATYNISDLQFLIS